MIARNARELAADAARAETLLNEWPPTSRAVGTAQATLARLRIALDVEANMLFAEEIKQFGEPL